MATIIALTVLKCSYIKNTYCDEKDNVKIQISSSGALQDCKRRCRGECIPLRTKSV